MNRNDFLGVLPGVVILPSIVAKRDPGFDESLRLVQRLQARDDGTILPAARTLLFDHTHATDLAVVLFHGFTNCPAQYALFAYQLYTRGCNVLVPRLPEHGDVDRMTTRLERMTATQLTLTAMEAVDAARGLGRRLAVSGISLGGELCAWLATQRADIDVCVPVAPFFGIDHLWFPLSVFAAGALRATPPSRYVWWDDRLKERITPSHAYPRYPLRALGECFLIGEWTLGAQAPFPGQARTRVTFALNPLDPAVNNGVAAELSQRWRASGKLISNEVWLNGFPLMHDVIEPENPHECVKLCYPPLIELILSDRSA